MLHRAKPPGLSSPSPEAVNLQTQSSITVKTCPVHLLKAQRRPYSARTEVHAMRSRSFGGCAACRKRRIKCNEKRPSCSMCVASGLTCTYEKSLFFGPEDGVDLGEGRYRRPMLSERERRLMSEWIVTSVAPSAALKRIADIDEECEAAAESGDIQLSYGPFGAFKLSNTANPLPFNCLSQSFDIEHDLQLLPTLKDLDGFALESAPLPGQMDPLAMMFGPTDLTSDDCCPQLWNDLSYANRIHEVYDDTSLSTLTHSAAVADEPQSFWAPQTTLNSRPNQPKSPSPRFAITPAVNPIPQEAVTLLRHYQTTVLRLLTPFRHSKTPWHVLFIPQARNCLAALTLGEDVDDASLCAFYGTLSIGAFSLSGRARSDDWEALARSYRNLARKHAKMMLHSAYDIPKKAKYKTTLVALLTIVQLSTVCGDPDQTEYHFLEAERFIRLRGLHRRKSRKVRLLHHCYAFERILYESTLMSGESQDQRLHLRRAVEASGLQIVGQNAACFRLNHWTDLEMAMLRVKNQDEGENDLHLQIPGEWAATLYPDIFGVPEQWILLVSLIIQLGKEKDADRPHNESIGLSVQGFLERAKAVETLISQLQPPLGADPDLVSLLKAMKNALSIYFYKRILNVDSSMLKTNVENVQNSLPLLQSSQPDSVYGTARFIWPAFIAACEAEPPEIRLAFSAWFRDAARDSGLRLFTTTLTNLEKHWEMRPSSGSVNLSF